MLFMFSLRVVQVTIFSSHISFMFHTLYITNNMLFYVLI